MVINLSEINAVTYLPRSYPNCYWGMDVWWPPLDNETGTQSIKYTENKRGEGM